MTWNLYLSSLCKRLESCELPSVFFVLFRQYTNLRDVSFWYLLINWKAYGLSLCSIILDLVSLFLSSFTCFISSFECFGLSFSETCVEFRLKLVFHCPRNVSYRSCHVSVFDFISFHRTLLSVYYFLWRHFQQLFDAVPFAEEDLLWSLLSDWH